MKIDRPQPQPSVHRAEAPGLTQTAPVREPAHPGPASGFEPSRDLSRLNPPGPGQLQSDAPVVRASSPSLPTVAASVGQHGGAGRAGSSPLQRAAEAVYRRHGDTPHDLGSRADIGRLISRTPQVDNMRATQGDTTRCGGAAVFNGLLLDGAPAANAQALREVATSRHITISPDEARALTAMEGGHLTPTQTAHLQELTYRTADSIDARHVGTTTGAELTELLGRLRQAGAFPNSTSVNVRLENNGADTGHWTVSSEVAGQGVARADSWPMENGYADVSSLSPAQTAELRDFRQSGLFNPLFVSDVTMSRADAQGNTQVVLRDTGVPIGQMPTSITRAELRYGPGGETNMVGRPAQLPPDAP